MAATQFKVKAVYDYTSAHEDDLNFPIGQIINVTELEGDDWYIGEYTDVSGTKKEGLFPTNFVEKYEPEVPTRPTRPSRPKQDTAPPPTAAPAAAPTTEEDDMKDDVPVPPIASKPQAANLERPPPGTQTIEDETISPPPAPKLAPAEPAPVSSKPGPPPVAPKSNAFKDRIAAFNKVEQPPKPVVPGGKPHPGNFIKKAFVAPPPSSSSYIPTMPKQEPIHRPYHREEDPEIKQKQEEDRAAAEAAGLTSDVQRGSPDVGEEESSKPMSLKERMAMLQEQQRLQAERNAEVAHRREKKVGPRKEAAHEADNEDVQDMRQGSEPRERQSIDATRQPARHPSAQRRPQEPMSPGPPVPQHEIISGGEEADQSAAGETTEDDAETIGPVDDDKHATSRQPPLPPPLSTRQAQGGETEDRDEEDEAENEEEEELDEEEQRKQRLRERMARLAGPQGSAGMPFNPFGAPPPAPPKKKSTRERKAQEEDAPASPPVPPQRVPIMPMTGMQRVQSPEPDLTEREPKSVERESENLEEDFAPPRRSLTGERAAVAPVPKGRPVPPLPAATERNAPPVPSDSSRPTPRPPQAEGRPVPPPPPAGMLSPGPGSESDDEMSTHARRSSIDTSGVETPLPIQSSGVKDVPAIPRLSQENRRSSYFSSEPGSATSEKRASRAPPPIPGSGPMSPRPPPPPPPAAPVSSRPPTDLQAVGAHDEEQGESEYEGDYDTDIASSAKHKDALKAHGRVASIDESTTADDTPERTPVLPSLSAQTSAPRAVPPLPPQGPPPSRKSIDHPRAPPPLPPSRTPADVDDDYDPYRYTDMIKPIVPVSGVVPAAAPPAPPPREHFEEPEDSSADDVELAPSRNSIDRAPPPPPHAAPPQDRAPPPPPHAPIQEHAPPPPPPHAAPQDRAPPPPPAAQLAVAAPSSETGPRQSLSVQRTSTVRRSMEQGRPSGELGQMATDIDLGEASQWWTAQQALPPILQSRNGVDILSESEESTTSKRGGRTQISKDVYVLYMDYSQTIITARFDSRDPADVTLEQRHEPVPPKLRQDQLEAYWQKFGARISEAVRNVGHSKKDSVVGDGMPYSLPLELIRAQSEALLPVGTRAYGGLVYANMANASTQQFDEIRPGDIVTLRNARFEGSHGAIKQKYKQDYGPSHVAIVDEWDGTKRSVKAWEQGREKKGGTRLEKFRLGDLRSGEVRIWRVVGRDWVAWSD